jgi:hypothetical protein
MVVRSVDYYGAIELLGYFLNFCTSDFGLKTAFITTYVLTGANICNNGDYF